MPESKAYPAQMATRRECRRMKMQQSPNYPLALPFIDCF